MKHHLLIITRDYEDQETFLTLKDFEALCICLNEFNGLGYYNGGEEAGASQSHKHLQIVPLPLTPEGPDVPIEPLLATARFKDGLGTIPAFPFLHVLAVFNRNIVKNSSNAARDCFDLYGQMLRQVIMEPPDAEKLKKQSGPYCLLIAREWMLLVPRSCEFFESISINSLGFAGALLVRNREQLELLRKSGPMKALQSVALPGKGSGS
jgi:ATP adenylyltransferase